MGHALDNTLQDVLIRWRRHEGRRRAVAGPAPITPASPRRWWLVRNLEQEGIGLAVEGAEKR